MNIFAFDPAAHRSTYAERGWVHVRRGLTDTFLKAAQAIVSERMAGGPLAGRGIAGEKAQFVFDFPEAGHYPELFDAASAMCGKDRRALTLSERHVKAYEDGAEPWPTAHKDRFASQVAIGLSLAVPEGSHLVLYPEDDVWENPFLDTSLRDSLAPDRLPEVVLAGAREVEIHDAPGDVIMFRGSAMWHLRRRSAGTVNIYVKLNDFGSDPLGEDPSTPVRRRATLALAEQGDAPLAAATVTLGRRFDSVARQYRREGWPERLFAGVWGQPPFPVSEPEVALLQAASGIRSVGDLLAAVPGAGPAAVRRLARRGALDLLAP
jgi:hypothetical protein